MPGVSSATPVIANGRVYVATNDSTRKKLSGMCFDAATGNLLWEKVLVDDAEPNPRNDMASNSPVTDGERVFFTFGNGELFALDKDGDQIFHKNLTEEYGPVFSNWGYSSSPLLLGDVLYIQNLTGQWWTDMGMMNHTDAASYIVAISAVDGETLWKVGRSTDCIGESFDSYTSPIPYEFNGETVIAVMGGDYITGHDLKTGEELFRHFHNPRQGRTDRLIPSPVVADDLIVGLQPRGIDAFAFNPADGNDLKYDQSAWIYAAKTSDVPTPCYYDNKIFIVNGARKQLLCLDPKTGAEIYYEDLGADTRIWSSPTIADGKLYALTETGQVVIAAASDEFEVINKIDLGSSEPCKASIAIANDRLYIRTADKLYCVAE